GEAAIGDETDIVAQPLADQGAGDGQHLPHAGAAHGTFAADHDDVARLDGAALDRLEAGFFTIENAGRAGHLPLFEACDLGDGPFRSQVAMQDDDVTRWMHGLAQGPHDRLPALVDALYRLEVFGQGRTGAGDAVPVDQAGFQQGLQDGRRPA